MEFTNATLPSGTINDTRWREYPTPKRVRDGYTIAQYEYDTKRGGWCKPYFVVYFNSDHISRDKVQHTTLKKAIKAANQHKAGE